MSLQGLKRQAAREGWAKWIRNDADEHALVSGCRFQEGLAEHVAGFFPTYLRHSKGKWAGKPFDLLPWQRDDIIYPIFGWVREDGTRRYRISYVEICKKNGKSTLASGIGLYLFAGDGEPGSHVFSAATDQKQASIVHGEAIQMVEASPELSRELNVNRTNKNIWHPGTKSLYRALASVASGQEGLDAHGLIIDELHVWKGRALWDGLRFAGRGRDQPLRFVITTAGDDYESVCREQHDYAEAILDGTFHDMRFFAYIRAAATDDDLEDEAVWHKANPSLRETIRLDDFGDDLREAQRTPGSWASFKRYSFGHWSTSTNPWLLLDDWDRCYREFSESDLEGMDCWGGLDLAQTRDTTALVLVFRDPEDDEAFLLLPRFYLPEAEAEEQKDRVTWHVWRDAGLVTLTPGNVCDYRFLKRDFAEAAEKFNIIDFAYDDRHAEQLTQEIKEETGVERFKFPQTIMSFAEPTEEFERLVLMGKMRHNGHKVFRWQIGNTQIYENANADIRPIKPRANDYRKIDGVVAAIMALARATAGTDEESVYKDRGVLTF